MEAYPDRDCAHMRGEYSPIVHNGKIVGSRLTDWCCDLNGDQSCGTGDCPTDRGRYATRSYSPVIGNRLLEKKYA
jgi:hypothetical protein